MNKNGSALHQVIRLEISEIVNLLLNKGADVDETFSLSQYRPSHEAIKTGSMEISQLLLDNGADLSVTLASGKF